MRTHLTVITAALLVASPARADNTEGFDKKPEDIIASDKLARDEAKTPGDKDKAAPDPSAKDKLDPTEEPSKAYRFIGLRFRDVIVPKFMINLFADGGATVNVPSVGVEFTTRKDRLMVVFGLQYMDYSMNPFMFKGHKEGDTAYEIVASSMKQIMFNVDLLYEIPLDKQSRYSFLVGGGVGIGGVFGNLYRSQAAPIGSPNPNDYKQWNYCAFHMSTLPAMNPNAMAYCEEDNGRFNRSQKDFQGYTEPSWANGGSKPFIVPWLALPQIGFRWKPIKQFESRFDFGFSISGFFLGLAASYGL